jgi:5-methyltetrahydrofolate--homocysteine methyltransferase
MIIVGELINASRKSIATAIEKKDVVTIQKVARDQADAGADYIDVNAGVFVGREPEYLQWLVSTVQEVVDAPCCIDSPDPKAIEAALSVHKGIPMINSISLEKERYEALMPILSGSDFKTVALCMSDDGMPETADDRLDIADRLINALLQHGVPTANIHVDPLVQPVATNVRFGESFLEAIERITAGYDDIHTMCGLSNISYGLPERGFLNRAFMAMAIARGLDGAIINPLDKGMMAGIVAAEALMGRDDFCMQYIKAYRAGVLEG